jgi:hypothetical protein
MVGAASPEDNKDGEPTTTTTVDDSLLGGADLQDVDYELDELEAEIARELEDD